jgi:hypothetical protein
MEQKAVYKAINAVQTELAKEGISKDRRNSQQNYSFRGIDDVYNALSPLLAKHHLCILPRVLKREATSYESKTGGTIFNVVVEAEFDFISADDGSAHVIKTFGEAMDSADKATNKAMSAAYKYAAFQAFAIPTEGDNDADASHHQVQPRPTPPTRSAQPPPTNGTAKQYKVPPADSLSFKQALWENIRTHCNGKNGDAGKILKRLTGKQFYTELTEEGAKAAQMKFESEYLGSRQPGEEG